MHIQTLSILSHPTGYSDKKTSDKTSLYDIICGLRCSQEISWRCSAEPTAGPSPKSGEYSLYLMLQNSTKVGKELNGVHIMYLSLFPGDPTWSIEHPWKALFHFSFLILRLSLRLLGGGISPLQGRYINKENKRKHPCLEWDSNPRSQRSSKRRQFIP
jgi:hypothetical protein